MNKKNDKKLCWNCDGGVSLHLTVCPYCGVDLSQDGHSSVDEVVFQNINSEKPSKTEVPASPYAHLFDNESKEEKWNIPIEENQDEEKKDSRPTMKKEMIAMLLLLPGMFFLFFGLVLLFFSSDGLLTLIWKDNFAYFYFLGGIPLILFGFKSLK